MTVCRCSRPRWPPRRPVVDRRRPLHHLHHHYHLPHPPPHHRCSDYDDDYDDVSLNRRRCSVAPPDASWRSPSRPRDVSATWFAGSETIPATDTYDSTVYRKNTAGKVYRPDWSTRYPIPSIEVNFCVRVRKTCRCTSNSTQLKYCSPKAGLKHTNTAEHKVGLNTIIQYNKNINSRHVQ